MEQIIYDKQVDLLEVSNVWDSHGSLIPWENDEGKKTQTFRNKHIRIEKVVKEIFDHLFQFYVLYIDGKEYSAIDLYKIKGNSLKLRITACVGQG